MLVALGEAHPRHLDALLQLAQLAIEKAIRQISDLIVLRAAAHPGGHRADLADLQARQYMATVGHQQIGIIAGFAQAVVVPHRLVAVEQGVVDALNDEGIHPWRVHATECPEAVTGQALAGTFVDVAA